MATYTTTGIVNHALVLCGASKINDITDDTQNARTANTVYENARKDFLTEARWTFAVTRSSLATVSTADLVPFYYEDENYVYQKPSNALRIWQMSDIEAIWRLEGDYIISNSSTLGTLYTFDHEEVGLWHPKAVTAFIDKLCVEVCYQIVQNATLAATFFEKYTKVSLPQAKTQASQTGTHQQVIDDEWLSAKFGNGGLSSRSYG